MREVNVMKADPLKNLVTLFYDVCKYTDSRLLSMKLRFNEWDKMIEYLMSSDVGMRIAVNYLVGLIIGHMFFWI